MCSAENDLSKNGAQRAKVRWGELSDPVNEGVCEPVRIKAANGRLMAAPGPVRVLTKGGGVLP